MKKHALLFILLAVNAIVFADKGLIVTQKYNTGKDGQHVTVTWYITDTQCKLKMVFSDKDVNTTTYFIPDVKRNQLLSYSDAPVPAGMQKTYYGIPVGNIKADAANRVVVERTSETKTISGVICDKVISKIGNTSTEIWVTKEFNANFYMFAQFFKSSNELKALSEGKINGFPLSSVTKDPNGKVVNGYELISVSSTEISDTEFAVPSDYKIAGSK